MKLKSTKISHVPMEIASDSDGGYFPHITLNEKAVPELAKKKIGDTCQIVCEVKVKGLRSDNSGTVIEAEVTKAGYYEKE